MISPAKTDGSRQTAEHKELRTQAKANPLRSRGEIHPASGTTQEPMIGKKTAANSRDCVFIVIEEYIFFFDLCQIANLINLSADQNVLSIFHLCSVP